MPEYMSPLEVLQSAAIGNAVARRIANGCGKPIKANAAIRHAIATKSVQGATALACKLLGLNHADASNLVATLANSKPDDITSPYYA